MIRSIACAAAAVLLTTGAVAAMADTGDLPSVSIDHKTGDYCIETGPITGTMLPRVECRSVDDWARKGVTFARR